MPTRPLPLPTSPCRRLELPDADVRLWPHAVGRERADALFESLRANVVWQQEHVVIFGTRRLVPRLVAWHGDPATQYVYSGTAHEPLEWTAELLELR